MTNKIPVGTTISRAYRFAFTNILNNLGAIWIPVAILYGGMFAFSKTYMASSMAMLSRDPQSLMRAMPFLLTAYVVMFILVTAQFAALTKEALGLRRGSAWLQFPFGRAMWRLLWSYLALIAVTIIFYIGCILAVIVTAAITAVVMHGASGAGMGLIVGIAAIVLGGAIFCAFFYSLIRLSFLLAPLAVAEGHQTLTRGWELTRGNFWRIFVLILSVAIPLLILECVYFYFVFGPNFLIPPHIGSMTQDQLAAWNEQRQAVAMHVMQQIQQYWFIVYPIGLAVAVIMYGLSAALSAFAYRALVPDEIKAESELHAA